MKKAAKCAFCGYPSQIVLTRTLDGKVVPACRQCVPKQIKLSWAENPPPDITEAVKTLDHAQQVKINQ